MAENTFRQEEKKTKRARKPKKDRKAPQINIKPLAFLKDRRFQLSVGLFLLILSICLFIAFTSYLFTGNIDQSEITGSSEGVKETGKNASNWLGFFGEWLSHIFIFKGFGIAAYLIIPIVALVGYQITFQTKVKLLKKIFKASLFSLFWISTLIGYFFVAKKTIVTSSYLAGAIGFELADWCSSLIGWGTILVLIFSLAVFVIYFFDIKSLIKNESDEDLEDDEPIEDKHQNFIQEENDKLYTPAEELIEQESDEDESPSETEKEPIDEPGFVNREDILSPIDDGKGQEKDKEETTLGAELVFEDTPKPPVKKPIKDAPLEFTVEVPETPEEAPIEEEITMDVEDEVVENIANDNTTENYDPTLDLPHYKYPPIDLLENHVGSKVQVTREELEANKDKIVETLGNYKIGISSIKATIGPTVTLYEIVPEAGIKISKIKNLEDDIALGLAALGIRIIAPIPGKGTIGIEVPNKNRELVAMKAVMSTDKFLNNDQYQLPIVFGKTISNETFVIDLAKMPHVLMAGATGQGKSVGINVVLASLLYKKHPSQLKFVLVDPKKVELSIYSTIEKHFLAALPGEEEPIITDTKKVIHTLNSLCIEMDTRYDLLKNAGCRNIKEYNKKFIERKLNPNNGHHFMPYIVVVIDELADLMMTAGKEVETPIARLAQLARAIGIHLVIATQRPSVNVITGVIKANFPARISFKVTSKIDSRTILDSGGADQLIGMGDMLFTQGSDITRIQCAFIDTPEVDKVCDFIGEQRGYDEAYPLPEFIDENEAGGVKGDLADRDAMFEEAARLLVRHQQGSTSLIQRKLKLGYNRAGRIIDQLEIAGVVGPFEGSKAREVLIKDELSLEALINELNGIR